MTVPGIGPLIASAMVAAIGNGAAFAKGRDFAAWLGLVPIGCARISIMARSHKRSMQGPDTDAQDHPLHLFTSGLQRTAGPYRWAKTGNTRSEQMTSALPPKADSTRTSRQQTIGVLIRAALPRALRVAEVDIDVGRQGKSSMIRKLLAPVPSQRFVQLSW